MTAMTTCLLWSFAASFTNNNNLSPPASAARSILPNRRSDASALYSLNKLVEDIEASNQSKLIFVGGKGGVGKTTTSSALAVHLASSYTSDKRVLIVSTDPAHSLGDALDVKLTGDPLLMNDPLTCGKLTAVEVDPVAALDDFKSMLEAFDVNQLADALGVSPSLLEDFGLAEFSSLLNNPPPGLDELVALSNVLDSATSVNGEYDVVVVDTAPTGHTLRLLALPAFLDGFLGKLIDLRMKLSGLASTLQAFFGSSEASQRAKTIDNALQKLESFRTKMSGLRNTLSDSLKTNFLIVTIPTKLGVAESKRLLTELRSQNVQVSDIVVNQCIGGMNAGTEGMANYYERRKAGQQKCLASLKHSAAEVSSSEEFIKNGNTGPIAITETPFFDVELVGTPALGYLGKSCYANNPSFDHLMGDTEEGTKVVICGGKGGVGKTTTSSAIAVAMAEAGHNVALISTDPAHSLGDALDMNLAGGALVDCPLVGMYSEGSLQAMEVDPSAALKQFKGVIDQLVGSAGPEDPSPGGLGSTLRELGEIFDTLPAGTDEVVALAKVIGIIRKGNYDRVVLDTAPTGHTLRMLSTPGFLADLIDRVLVIARKINSNPTVKMMISGAAKNEEELNAAAASAKATLQSFQIQMFDLEDLFADAAATEFLIVTALTELSVRESTRLLNDLTFEAPEMPIKVRNIVANQVLNEGGNDVDAFMGRVKSGQEASIKDLSTACAAMHAPPGLTLVPFLDTEPRGVFGLKVLADELMKDALVEQL